LPDRGGCGPDHRIERRQPLRFGKVGLRPLRHAPGAEGQSAIEVRFDVIGIALQGDRQVLDRGIVSAERMARDATAAMGIVVAGAQRDRAGEVGDRGAILAAVALGLAAVEQPLGAVRLVLARTSVIGTQLLVEMAVPVAGAVEPEEVGIEADRGGPVGVLGIEAIEPVLGDRALEIGVGIVRREADRRAVVGQCLLWVFVVAKGIGAPQVSARGGRIEADRRGEIPGRTAWSAISYLTSPRRR
jgi:hypothetical protein